MFKFCPSCASGKISFEQGKVFRCPDCGFVYYHNIAAATGCLISVPETGGVLGTSGGQRLMFLVRGKEPAKGMLDLPGGFVDPGEGALEGLYRELWEEIGWVPPIPAGADLSRVFKLFASFPNVYPYKGIVYNTCDMFFTIAVPGLTEKDFRLEAEEISKIRFLRPEEINPDDIAFDSTRRAIEVFKEFTRSRKINAGSA